MCGIAGFVRSNGVEPTAERILRMTRAVQRRGPDGEGLTLVHPESGCIVDLATDHTPAGVEHAEPYVAGQPMPHTIALGHRRFSIIDLSVAGHQPFWSAGREACLTFNGEIYNYIEVRRELQARGHVFHTDSDTEVLLQAYLEWGEDCFRRFNGFWAVAIFDTRRDAVLLSRDRIGVAPLYFTETPEGVFWASEIKALRAGLPDRDFAVRDQAVWNYTRSMFRDVFHETFFEGIRSLPNGCFMWVDQRGPSQPVAYWQLPTHRRSETEVPVEQAVAEFRELLTDALRLRLRADVPVGFELSGGMDSSALTALAATTGVDMRAYTVSFPDSDVDEEVFARAVADRYRDVVQYNVLEAPPEDFFANADRYVALMDEPFHSPNMRTNQAIWEAMAERGIKVSINGGAGDELLAGYAYLYHQPFLRHLLDQGQTHRFWHEFFAFSEHHTGGPKRMAGTLFGVFQPEKKEARRLRPRVGGDLDPLLRPDGVADPAGPRNDIEGRLIDTMGHWQMNYWMRSGNVSFMGVPVEVRAPFLDYRLVEYCFTLPVTYLIRDGWMKWLLRKATEDVLPESVVWRKQKSGFPFPLADWCAQNEATFFEAIEGSECPYLDLPRFRAQYAPLARADAGYLWRLMCLALWWKRCVEGQPLPVK